MKWIPWSFVIFSTGMSAFAGPDEACKTFRLKPKAARARSSDLASEVYRLGYVKLPMTSAAPQSGCVRRLKPGMDGKLRGEVDVIERYGDSLSQIAFRPSRADVEAVEVSVCENAETRCGVCAVKEPAVEAAILGASQVSLKFAGVVGRKVVEPPRILNGIQGGAQLPREWFSWEEWVVSETRAGCPAQE